MSRTITAMFDDRTQAEAASEQLTRELSIDRSAIQIHAADPALASTAPAGDTGFWSSLKDLFVADEDRVTYAEGVRRGAVVVSARIDDHLLDRAMDVLEHHGAVDLDSREAEWRQEGWTGAEAVPTGAMMASSPADAGLGVVATDAAMPASVPADRVAATATAARTGGEEVIPIVEESLRVGKRDVERGRVRVRSYVVSTPVSEQVTLREEHVDVQRRVVDRPVTDADALFQERTIEATESAEEAVIAKDVRVTGEVVVRKDATERTQTVNDTVRRTEVEVDDTTTPAGHVAAGLGSVERPAVGEAMDTEASGAAVHKR